MNSFSRRLLEHLLSPKDMISLPPTLRSSSRAWESAWANTMARCSWGSQLLGSSSVRNHSCGGKYRSSKSLLTSCGSEGAMASWMSPVENTIHEPSLDEIYIYTVLHVGSWVPLVSK